MYGTERGVGPAAGERPDSSLLTLIFLFSTLHIQISICLKFTLSENKAMPLSVSSELVIIQLWQGCAFSQGNSHWPSLVPVPDG